MNTLKGVQATASYNEVAVEDSPVFSATDLVVEYTGKRGATLRVLDGISFAIAPGEFVSIIGPSGCGKTSLLNVINDLLPPASGTLVLNANSVAQVFQRPMLLPWRTVLDNAIYGLECRGQDLDMARGEARLLLARMGLEDHLSDYPHQLSEGMKQRVNLARALLVKPDILLMDEPYSSLDEPSRRSLQNRLLRLWEERGFAVIHVSHSLQDVAYLSDRVIVFSEKPTKISASVPIAVPRPRNSAEALVAVSEYVESLRNILCPQ